MGEKFERVKNHINEHKIAYSCTVTGVIVAGFTVLIMRGVAKQHISRDFIVTAGRDFIVTRKRVVTNNVSYISSNRQGAPSWVIRCIETGAIFASQHAAALEMSITESNLSRHLNGLLEHAQGYHFERICMAA